MQKFQAVLLSSVSLMIMAQNNPFPLTLLINGYLTFNFSNSAINIFPKRAELSANPSSKTTFIEAMATLQANGFPP